MGTTVTVTTGARLHFGPLAAAGPTGGQFGGVGMMITAPRYVVSVSPAVQDSFVGDQATVSRAAEFLHRVRESLFGEQTVPPCQVTFLQAISPHAGLGSGTQLGLAVARAVSELLGESDVPVEVLARRTGRGLRSAIGLHGFSRGGFLVDGGRAGSGRLGTLVARLEFPSAWRLLLVSPPQTMGLSGADEQRAFASQPPMPDALTAKLCRITLMDWLPGLVEANFARVANAMYDFGLAVGQFFEAAQGGVFSHSTMRQLAEEVRRRGLPGVAQTSWGPTICILCDTGSTARQLAADLARDSRWAECLFQVAEPLNHGATVEHREISP